MKVKVFSLNAFTKNENGGNPAGVVMDADGLREDQMLLISKKVGFSETAFIQTSNKADFKVRFFTPNAEVDICGHATIATFCLLMKKGMINPGKYFQETRAGILPIEISENGVVFMDQSHPQYFDTIDASIIVDSLNIRSDSINSDIPIQIVSTGLRDIFIPIKTIEELTLIKPNFEKIKEVSNQLNIIGYHLFTLETKFGGIAHCRNFAPLYDIEEEAATGTSTGALACYLFNNGKLQKEQLSTLSFEQGYCMGRPSEINVKLQIDANNIIRVCVGGVASIVNEIELEI